MKVIVKRPLKPFKKRVCKQCNTPFLTKYDRKVFCNNRCKCEWHNTRERLRLAQNKMPTVDMVNEKWGEPDEVPHTTVSTSS